MPPSHSPGQAFDGRRIGFVLGAAIALVVGWRTFWFLCDDAFIEFRYVSNSALGHGYVWNAPPFRPVEGYTSFLWIALLDLVWRVLRVAPPESANVVSLLFNLGSLTRIVSLVDRLPLSTRLAPYRLQVLGGVFALTLTNRAFLGWTSSGLETSMVTFLILGWMVEALTSTTGSDALKALFPLATWATLLALARPDGYLYAAATLLIIALHARLRPASLLAATPLLAVLVHVLWRRGFYGYWLPNSYYAKHVAPWPEMGAVYVGSFVYEFAYWIWLLMLVGLAGRWLRTEGLRALPRALPVRVDQFATWTRVLAVLTVVGHFGYYTFNVGGDHFEYRIYHHLVPLIAVAFFWTADGLGWTWAGARRVACVLWLLGLILPWTHWWHSRHAVTKSDPGSFVFPIAGFLPGPLAWYAMPWDLMHEHMLRRFVGIRHQGHKTYLHSQKLRFPDRETGSKIPADDLPIYVAGGVGWPAWAMPHVYVIDKLGLNDVVIARNPDLRSSKGRSMAHDRQPPPGYLECFEPNVQPGPGDTTVVRRRPRPFTAADVRRCEAEFLERVTTGR
jgi:arabinofuranosyltransferase